MSKPDLNIRMEIASMAEGLPVNATINSQLCPWCRGGRQGHDLSFSVTRSPGGLLYNCYRASCGASHRSSGFISGGAIAGPRKVIPPPFVPRYFRGDITKLTDEQKKTLAYRYNLFPETLDHFGVSWCKENRRYIVPVYNREGFVIGLNARVPPDSKSTPKTIAYKEDDEAWCAWHKPIVPMTPKRFIVVEDQWSAMRIAQTDAATGIALLGTHMDGDTAESIAKESPSVVYLALDRDATSLSHKIKQYWGLMFRECRITALYKDIKDMTPAEFEIYMGAILGE